MTNVALLLLCLLAPTPTDEAIQAALGATRSQPIVGPWSNNSSVVRQRRWIVANDGSRAYGGRGTWLMLVLPEGRVLGSEHVKLFFFREEPSVRALSISQSAYVPIPRSEEQLDHRYSETQLLAAKDSRRVLVARFAFLQDSQYLLVSVADLSERGPNPNVSRAIRLPGRPSDVPIRGDFVGDRAVVEFAMQSGERKSVSMSPDGKLSWQRPELVYFGRGEDATRGRVFRGLDPIAGYLRKSRETYPHHPYGTFWIGGRVVWHYVEPEPLTIVRIADGEERQFPGYSIWGTSANGRYVLVYRHGDQPKLMLMQIPLGDS
jgi:hypothetical protein